MQVSFFKIFNLNSILKIGILGLILSLPINGFSQEYEEDEKIQKMIERIDYYTGRDNKKALNLTRKIIEHGESINSNKLVGIGNIRRAVIYDIMSEPKYAVMYFQKGIEELEKTQSTEALSFAYNNFGIHYYLQKNYDDALRYYGLSMKMDSLLGDEESIIITQINRAIIFKKTKYYDEALSINFQCLDYYTNSKFDSTMQFTLNQNIGSIYYEKNELDSSFYYVDKALKFLDHKIDLIGHAGIHTLLCNLLNKKGDYQKGLFYGKEALKYAEKVDSPGEIAQASQALSDSYQALGDFRNAYIHFTLFHRLNDSLLYAEKLDAIRRIQTEYQRKLDRDKAVLQSSLELKELETEYMVLQQEHESHKSREFFIITVLVLISILIIVMLAFSWNKTKTNKELRKKNEIIETALADKDILIKEVHHRVKNNLQLIVSMMELDSINIQNEEARQKIRDTITRIQSIGIIHQRLHEQENVTEIASNIYFTKLVDEILRTSKENVQFNTHFDHFYLNIDEGISFGLILNEMITNSIKYVDEKEIQINIDFSRKNDNLIMSYSDNGTIKGNVEIKGTGFGMKLIRIMTKKLKGKLETIREKGIRYELVIENYFK